MDIIHSVKDFFEKKAYIDNRVKHLTPSDIISMTMACNKILGNIYKKDNIVVSFEVPEIDDSNIFWRFSTNIKCFIINTETQKTIAERNLSIKEFELLYVQTKHLEQIPNKCNIRKLTRYIQEDNCILCDNATPNSVLPCGHSFCRTCVDLWVKPELQLPKRHSVSSSSHCLEACKANNRQQCPICREVCPNSSDAWDFLPEPDHRECREEMAAALLCLLKKAGSPLSVLDNNKPNIVC